MGESLPLLPSRTPLIGVANARKVLGPDDGFPNEDNIGLHLGNKLRDMVTAAADFSDRFARLRYPCRET